PPAVPSLADRSCARAKRAPAADSPARHLTAKCCVPRHSRPESAGSEVAHQVKLDADHRPPLKRGVRFSRATLSRRLSVLRCNRRNQFDKLDQLILAIHLALRQLLPTAVTPAFVPMRPNAPLDPMVEFVEKRSDVSTLVIVTPSPQNRVQLIDQIFGFQGHATLGKLAHSIL